MKGKRGNITEKERGVNTKRTHKKVLLLISKRERDRKIKIKIENKH